MVGLSCPPEISRLASQVEPVLRANSSRAERERRLPPESVAALKEAQLFRTWAPKAYGGLEMDPLSALHLFEEVARVDSAAGWILGNCAFISMAPGLLPDACGDEIFATPDSIVCGSFVAKAPCTAEQTDGGYLVSGRWTFGSGCHFADWQLTLAMLTVDGQPQPGPGGAPEMVIAAFPGGAATIHDTWHTLGMRGTGSHDFSVERLFVPRHRTTLMGPWENAARAYAGPLYRFGPWIDSVRIAATALGIARAALDSFLELAAGKIPSYTQAVLADRSTVQDRAARARALIEAGHSYIHATVAEAWAAVQDGPRLNAETGFRVGLSAAFGLDAAVRAGDLVYELAGSTAFREDSPIEQRFRDLQTLRQNAITSTARFESLGKLMLGRPSDWAFHNL